MVSVNQTGESKKSGNANSRRQGTITHTPIANDKNVYRIRYTLPAEKNGKQKRVTETIRGTKTYAQKTLTKRLAQLEAKRHVDKTKLTVARFIQDWFGNHPATPYIPFLWSMKPTNMEGRDGVSSWGPFDGEISKTRIYNSTY